MRKLFELAAAVFFACGWQSLCHASTQLIATDIPPRANSRVTQVAEADLNTILPLGMGSSTTLPASQGSAAFPPHPTYEKWDVLRQYPRFVPVPQPPQSQLPAAKPQEAPQPPKENQNA